MKRYSHTPIQQIMHEVIYRDKFYKEAHRNKETKKIVDTVSREYNFENFEDVEHMVQAVIQKTEKYHLTGNYDSVIMNAVINEYFDPKFVPEKKLEKKSFFSRFK